jgi:hypothetical protein
VAIDLIDRYVTAEFMPGGPARWTLDRGATPYRAIVLHHTAGWYGARLHAGASRDEEVSQIDAMARDHAARAAIGIGPAYNYVAFPSGRLYAVGRVGTHRAHTKGRNPRTGERWNVEAAAVCAMGDYERDGADELSSGLSAAIEAAVEEARAFPFTIADAPLHGHGLIPTVDASGRAFPQATACPGRRLLPLVERLNTATRAPGVDLTAELAAIRAAVDEIERKARSASG